MGKVYYIRKCIDGHLQSLLLWILRALDFANCMNDLELRRFRKELSVRLNSSRRYLGAKYGGL